MLVLFETPAGFALFKVLDEGKLNKVEDIYKDFETPEAARKVVKLKAFEKFENTTDALGAATALVDSKLSKGLRKFLKEQCSGETLAIADSKLGRIISDKLEINCVHNSAIMELLRGVKSQVGELISGLSGQEMTTMSLGLAHSLSRYTLKFSPDKVDTMIVQAIGLLDDLDKELNTYAMRVREWYGWHFPELGKIVQDNIQYAQAVKLMGNRINAKNLDFSAILAEEIEAELKEAVIISMGTEVSDEDMASIKALCDQVISLSEYRGQLFDYLRSRMNAIAPNLTVLVGELVGARLIAHAGSLVNLAKQPASTVQILGAEKALFRALKTKNQTPKYGLIYHASLVGQAAPKFKGKISRVLAAKSVLSIRYDALGEDSQATIGFDSRLKVEARLRQLEGKSLGKSAVTKGKAKLEAYDKDRKSDTPALLTTAKTYNSAMDSTLEIKSKASGKRSKDEADNGTAAEEPPRKKKKHSDKGITIEDVRVEELPKEVAIEEPSKKKKKKNKSENNGKTEEDVNTKEDVKTEEDMTSKKKKKKAEKGVIVKEEVPADEGEAEEETPKEKKKKKKAQVASEDLTASEGSSKASKKRKTGGEAVPVDVSDSAEKKKKKKDKKKDRDA